MCQTRDSAVSGKVAEHHRPLVHAADPDDRFFVFDMFGTLVYNRFGNLDAVHDAFHSLYPESDEDALLFEYGRFDREFRDTHRNHEECSIDMIIRHMDGKYGTETDIPRAEEHILVDTGTFVPVNGAERLLCYLKSHGYRIGVLSNTRYHGPAVRRILDDGGLGRYVDAVVTSADIGLKKPRPESYATVAERLGAPISRCFFAGDSVGNDYHGPIAAGMRSAVLVGDPKSAGILWVPGIGDIEDLFDNGQ